MNSVKVGDVTFSNHAAFALISGPCQIESLDHSLMLAQTLAEICAELKIPYVFKASFDKANRSSLSGARGVGIGAGMEILANVRERVGCPVITDVHNVEQCARAADHVDILQIPAFLCRQTDLLLAAGETGRAINVKKGQFLAPWDVGNIVDKIKSTGNDQVLLTERGASFGYNMLVSDMRSLPIMAETGCPVVFDATHSVQLPGGLGQSSGGQREFVAPLARAAVATGCGALFIETHQDPDKSPSDGPNMVPLTEMKPLLKTLKAIDEMVKG